MTGALVRDSGNALPMAALPAKVTAPEPSPPLDYLLRSFAERGHVALADAPRAVVAEARTLLPFYEAVCEAPDLRRRSALVWGWMEGVALAITLPPDEDTRRMKSAMVAETSGDLPAAVWTRETLVGFLRRGGKGSDFYPSIPAVDAYLRPIGEALRARRRALELLARQGQPKAGPIEPTGRTMTEEAKAAVLAKLTADLAAARSSTRGYGHQDEPAPAVQRPKAITLTGEALWTARNRRLVAAGLPPLPRPGSFEGYGMVSSGAGQ